jgi:hypothetical protein
VTFQDWDGRVTNAQKVRNGKVALVPASPARVGYTFSGWDKAFNNITADLVVTVQYTVNTYTVTFKNWDGSTLKTQTVEHGRVAIAPSNPTRTGYTFSQWDKTFSNITANLTVTAQYTVNTFTVTFKDWDGITLKKQIVEYSKAATSPANPVRSGYTFVGWGKMFDYVTADLTVTATFSIGIDIYNIGEETYRFKNYSDSDSLGGHCFGMSVTSSAYYRGQLNLSLVGGNYEEDLYALSFTNIVKAPICYYQEIQGSSSLNSA